ncbi:MAG: septum formation protein [Rhodospirillaceae bacterium]|nr:MAG: septum formation protein [Rhodospirillaceae bacterium]
MKEGNLPASKEPRRLPFVLASASPRRLALLRQIAVAPLCVDPADLDERPWRSERPVACAARLACDKAATVARRHPGFHVLAADTVVACGRRILPKAETAAEAERCLALLAGRRHRVLGGVCLRTPEGRSIVRVVTTIIAFKPLDGLERLAYLATNEWQAKAGGYAIQGRAATFVRFLSGSYSNVVGLPLYETAALLQGAGLLKPGVLEEGSGR